MYNYINMYIYIYICIYICRYTYVYIYTYIYIYIYINISTYILIYVTFAMLASTSFARETANSCSPNALASFWMISVFSTW